MQSPSTTTQTITKSKDDDDIKDNHGTKVGIGTDYTFKRKIVWWNAIGFLLMHLAGVYGWSLYFTASYSTLLWLLVNFFIAGQGITAGAHRLFTHKSYKATFSLRLMLLLGHTMAGQNCMYIWVRDHRQHHKFSDTDADPHNAHRGFFFSHIGWLMSKKHPLVKEKGKTIDMSDMDGDKLIMFQKKYYKLLYVLFAMLIPMGVPMFFWNETLWNAVFMCYFGRYIHLLNTTWLVNSAAHFFGTKPYDRLMKPVESALVAFFSGGEGWHNYHHAFPWDYRAAELGERYSITTYFIDVCAYFGLAYDLKTTSHQMVYGRLFRTGDGTHSAILRKARPLPTTDTSPQEALMLAENYSGQRLASAKS